ncbi:MAG: MmcQ/YjbR family DNA-binding protein [Ferruginibacter sp.]
MNAKEIRDYVLKKSDVTESFPFGDGVLVFKVTDKIFLLILLNEETITINIKCNPDRAVELREEYFGLIIPGFHMNKIHWNTVFPLTLKAGLVMEMIDDSYNLVLKKKRK